MIQHDNNLFCLNLAQSNTTMESYGQSAQMRDIISESPLMDSSSANASSGGGARASTNTTTTAPPSQTSTNPNQTTAQNIQQQTSARVSMNSTSSVPSSASSHDNASAIHRCLRERLILLNYTDLSSNINTSVFDIGPESGQFQWLHTIE